MTRHHGGEGTPVAECIDRHLGTWRVRTDFQPDTDEENGVTFIEAEFPYKPSMAEVKSFVHGVINAKTDEKILSGFVWNNKPVWLSEENQLNFTQGVVPVTFKIGEQEDGTPIYHEFTTAEDLKAFNDACIAWKQQCLADGYTEKDGIDWTPYEDYFKTEE